MVGRTNLTDAGSSLCVSSSLVLGERFACHTESLRAWNNRPKRTASEKMQTRWWLENQSVLKGVVTNLLEATWSQTLRNTSGAPWEVTRAPCYLFLCDRERESQPVIEELLLYFFPSPHLPALFLSPCSVVISDLWGLSPEESCPSMADNGKSPSHPLYLSPWAKFLCCLSFHHSSQAAQQT